MTGHRKPLFVISRRGSVLIVKGEAATTAGRMWSNLDRLDHVSPSMKRDIVAGPPTADCGDPQYRKHTACPRYRRTRPTRCDSDDFRPEPGCSGLCFHVPLVSLTRSVILHPLATRPRLSDLAAIIPLLVNCPCDTRLIACKLFRHLRRRRCFTWSWFQSANVATGARIGGVGMSIPSPWTYSVVVEYANCGRSRLK